MQYRRCDWNVIEKKKAIISHGKYVMRFESTASLVKKLTWLGLTIIIDVKHFSLLPCNLCSSTFPQRTKQIMADRFYSYMAGHPNFEAIRISV